MTPQLFIANCIINGASPRLARRAALMPDISPNLITYAKDQQRTRRNDFGIEMDQAIALSVGLMEASSPLTSTAGRGGLNR
jgi:hypothetical protein